MIIDKPLGNICHFGFSEPLNSLTELPSVIQFNIRGYLKRILGSMSDSVIFSNGQIVDLERRFKNDSATFGYSWIIPKYDLNFLLRDNSIGIKRYSLTIRLDKYGQILYSNWPKERYNNKSSFESRKKIMRFALKQAELKS